MLNLRKAELGLSVTNSVEAISTIVAVEISGHFPRIKYWPIRLSSIYLPLRASISSWKPARARAAVVRGTVTLFWTVE